MLQRITNLAFLKFDSEADQKWLKDQLDNPKSPLYDEIQFASNRWLANYNYVVISISKMSPFREAGWENLEVITQYTNSTDLDSPMTGHKASPYVIGSFYHANIQSWSHHS
jgi:hypothetical protein